MSIVRSCLAALLGLMLGANVMAQNAGSGTVLDTLFAKLKDATDPVAIQSLEAAIWEQWTMVPDQQQRAAAQCPPGPGVAEVRPGPAGQRGAGGQ